MNQEIHDSISYAYRIQQSVLPSLNGLQEIAPNSFILFKPKDIVSGDFYWYHQKDNKLFIAAVDCTGHGVPGAMMSIIGLNLFKDIIVKRGIEDPGTILKTIDYELDNTLNHDQTSTKTKDGMDVSLIVVDTENTTLQFAGAFRPLLVVSGESRVEYKGSRYPIGFFDLENKVFETQYIEVKKGDRLYLYSDGYNDQFGGERNKKLTRSRFYQFLETSELMDMEEQGSYLDYSIQNWKQNEPQTDDILVIGVEL